jgi:hypothetical protein
MLKIRPKLIHWGVNLYPSTDVKVKVEVLSLGKTLPLAKAIRIHLCGSVQMASLNSVRCRMSAMLVRHSCRSFRRLVRYAMANELIGPLVLNKSSWGSFDLIGKFSVSRSASI